MTDQMDWDRLARYLSGEAGAGERLEVERWASAARENRMALDAARRRWEVAADSTSWDVEGAWRRLQPRIREAAPVPGVLPLTPRSPNPWLRASRLLPLAAAAVLLLTVAIRFGPGGGTGSTIASVPGGGVFSTGAGEQRAFDLPDGSQVLLGAASTLRLEQGFGSGSRELSLEGQAFIRVTHDATRPFVVNASGTRTVDVGTAFEVRAYPSEEVRVAVTEGSVEVRRESGASSPVAVLQAGDVARLNGSDAVDIRRNQDVERLLGWTRGELSFDDTPLSEIALELERWFDVDCRIDSRAIEDLHLTVELRIGESLEEILRLVELSLSSHGVRTERDGRIVRFRSGTPVTPASWSRPTGRVEVGA